MKKTGPKQHSENTPNKQLEKERVPAGFRQSRLAVVDKDPEYHYRICNDTNNGSNLRRYLAGGYEIVPASEDAEAVGSESVHKGHSKDNSLDVGKGITAYLLRIPTHLWRGDQEEKMRQQDEVMAMIKRQPLDAEYNKPGHPVYNVNPDNKVRIDNGKRRSS